MAVVTATAGPAVSRRAAHPILALVGRRALFGIVTLFVVSLVVFLATQVLPGNAAAAVLGRNATPASLRALEHQMHLDRSVAAQYWTWLSGLFTGKLGNSLASGQPVWGLVSGRLINSGVLVFVTGAIGSTVGVALGAAAALRRDSQFDHVTSVAALAVTSLPEFVIAITLVILFSTVVSHLLPAVSILAPGTYAWQQPELLLESDYVEMARLKGVPEWQIVLRHALPNAIAPTIQVIGLNFLYLAGGIVVVEYIFNFPGIGQGLVSAVSDSDIPVIQLIVVILAAFYVFMNIVTDVIAVLATPRRRIAR